MWLFRILVAVITVTMTSSLPQSRYTSPPLAAAVTTRPVTTLHPLQSLANRLSILTRNLNTNYCSSVSNNLPHTPVDPDRSTDRTKTEYATAVCRLNYNVFRSCLASQLTTSSQSSNESVLCRHLGDVQRLSGVLRDIQGTVFRSIGSRCLGSPPSPNNAQPSIPLTDCSPLCQRQPRQIIDNEFNNRLTDVLRSAADLTLQLTQKTTSSRCSLPAATTPSDSSNVVMSNVMLSNVVVLEYADQLTEAIVNSLKQFQG